MSARVLLGAATLLLGVGEALSLTQSIEAYSRRWEGALHEAREATARERPALEAIARSEGVAAACALAVARGLAAEAEAFEPQGRRVAAAPRSAPITHWPSDAQRLRARSGEPVTLGPVAGPEPRILTYVGLADGALLLRLARAVSAEPSALPGAHRAELVAHATVLALTLAAALLTFAPLRAVVAPGSGGALLAYERALDQLRSRGEAISREHDEERRRMEGELKELEALARAGELTAGVVHEVRNGLGTVLGYARLMERDPSPPAAAEAGLRIRQECETLERVVRRFVDYVRRERLDLSPIGVAGLLRRVAGREARARDGVVAEVAVGEELALVGDEALLERAFENVVRNAIEASPSGGVVRVASRVDVDWVITTVEDEGPGLALAPEEALRPFRSARPGGLGLGLALANKLVRLHAGSIELQPRASRGLRVVVRLPREGPPAAPDVANCNAEGFPDSPPRSG